MKSTIEIVNELKLCSDFKTFYNENSDFMIKKSLSEFLNELLTQKGLEKFDVVTKSELSEAYGYQVFRGARIPERKKLLCIAVAMELNLEETQNLLKCAGYSQLYVKIPFDSIVMYGICKHKSVYEINSTLYDYGLETL